MAVKRIIRTDFWIDSYVMDHYSVEDKYFYIYLLSNPQTSQVGIYSLPRKIISFETGYTPEVITVLLDRFQNKYQEIIYNSKTQEITVLNSLKHSVVKGGKPVIDLIVKELGQVKDSTLISKTYDHLAKWWDQSVRQFDGELKHIFELEIQRRFGPIVSHKVKEKDNQIENVNHKEIINDYQKDNDNDESSNESSSDSMNDKLIY